MPKVVVLSPSGLVRFRLKKELWPRGFDVVETDDCVGASKAVRDQHIDIVLIDACSTSSAGLNLVRRLKDDPAISRTPVLFLDDHVPAGDEGAVLLAAGADGVVPRSDDFDALAATLSLHMRR